MNRSGKLVGVNLLILLAYALVSMGFSIGESGQYAGMGYGIFMMMGLGIHALVLLVLGIVFLVKKKRDRGLAYLLSLFVVLLVGFSACFGGMMAFDAKLI